MMESLDSKDPESLSKFLHQTAPDAAKDAIRKAIVFGWWLLPKHQRTDGNLEREILRLVGDAIREFKTDQDRFLDPDVNFSNSTSIDLCGQLILKVGQRRFGAPTELVRQSLMAMTQGERLENLLQKVHSALSWDDLMAET